MPLGQSLGPYGTIDKISIGRNPIQVIASAATIAPLGDMARVTGNTTIDTIAIPNLWWTGPLFLYNTDASVGTISTNGNVQLGVTLTRYKVFAFFYDPSTSKWYPSAIS